MSSNPYSSGEFDPKIGRRGRGNAAAIFNGCLWLIGTDTDSHPGDDSQYYQLGQSSSLRQSVFSLSNGIANGAATKSENWTTQWVTIPGLNVRNTWSRCAAVTSTRSNPGLFLFWNQAEIQTIQTIHGLLASQYTITSQSNSTPQWSSALKLLETDKQTQILPSRPSADVAATTFGDNSIFVACATTTSKNVQGTGPFIFLGHYNVKDIDPNSGTWPARQQVYIPASQLQTFLPAGSSAIKDLGTSIGLDWFSTFPNNAKSHTGTAPSNYLMLVIEPDYQHDSAGSPCLIIPTAESHEIVSDSISLATMLPAGGYRYQVVRDPAGRIFAYGTTQSKEIVSYCFSTFSLPSTPTKTTISAPHASYAPPAVGFFIDTATTQSSTPPDTYPVYQFVFYGSSVECQVNYFGTGEKINNFGPYTPKPKGKFILTGIFDGPIPVPNSNIQGHLFQDTDPNVGNITYGKTKTTEGTHQSSFAWTVGFKSEGSSDKGIGPAWDISLSGGTGSVQSDTTGTTQSSSVIQRSGVEVDAHQKGVSISALGTLLSSQAQIQATGYKFTDASGATIVDPSSSSPSQAMKSLLLQVNFTPPEVQSFTPFMFKPGDLSTYTPEAINKTMLALSGKSNYFEDVILANAYTFPDGKKYLSFTWSNSGMMSSDFRQLSNTFTENSWTFDSSDYVGVSGGAGVDFFGLGEDESFKFLAGFTVSLSGEQSSSDTEEWGIQVGTEGADWGPPTIDDKSSEAAIAEYTFLVFFLPVPSTGTLKPNAWTQELIDYSSVKGIATSSGAWRITFAVIQYLTNGDKSKQKHNTYAYKGNIL